MSSTSKNYAGAQAFGGQYTGLTILEYFASNQMAAYRSSPDHDLQSSKNLAEWAISDAKALINEVNKIDEFKGEQQSEQPADLHMIGLHIHAASAKALALYTALGEDDHPIVKDVIDLLDKAFQLAKGTEVQDA